MCYWVCVWCFVVFAVEVGGGVGGCGVWGGVGGVVVGGGGGGGSGALWSPPDWSSYP